MDWNSWLSQYPEFCREKAIEQMKKCKEEEKKHQYNSSEIPEINWEYWEKNIKSPCIIDWLKAEYEVLNQSNYGQFYMDKLTDTEREKILEINSEHKDEVDSIGRKYIINGIEKSFDEETKNRINSAGDIRDHSSLMLEELNKDMEQLKAFLKTYDFTSNSEEYAEFPCHARELEEDLVGNSFGIGLPVTRTGPIRELKMTMEQEDRLDTEYAEAGVKANEQEIEKYINNIKKSGVDINKEKYIELKIKKIQDHLNEVRAYCRETRSNDSVDPKTGEDIMEEINYDFVEVKGGG